MTLLRQRLRNKALRVLLKALLRPRSHGDLVRLGSAYGGWWVPKSSVRPGAVAYCAGAGEDITFDLALVAAGCKVTTFDPTPRAIAYVERVAPATSNFRFVPVGWSDESGTVRFYAPRDPSHVSHSMVNLQQTTEYFEAAVNTVAQLASEVGDEHIEIVKMDIEGAEHAVIGSILRDGPLPHVLCVEFDQPVPTSKVLGTVRKLRGGGYTLLHVDKWNYTFARTAVHPPL